MVETQHTQTGIYASAIVVRPAQDSDSARGYESGEVTGDRRRETGVARFHYVLSPQSCLLRADAFPRDVADELSNLLRHFVRRHMPDTRKYRDIRAFEAARVSHCDSERDHPVQFTEPDHDATGLEWARVAKREIVLAR